MTFVRRAGPWLAGPVFLLIYAATLTRIHTWDAMAYAARAAGNPLVSERFLSTSFWHPHHLLYMALAAPWSRALTALGLHGPGGMIPLQLLSALFGAGVVAMTAVIVRRTSGSDTRAWTAALGAGISNALWRYSTAVEVMTASLFFLLLGAYLLLDRRRALRSLGAGACLAAAILIHQIAVLFAAGFLLGLLPRWVRERGGRRAWWMAAAAAAALAAGVYLVVGRLALGITTPAGFADWMTEVRNRAHFEGTPLVSTLAFTARTLVESIVTPAPAVALRHQGASPWTEAGTALSILGAVGVGALAVRFRGRPRREDAPWFGGLVLGGALTVAFIAWFEPLNLEYAVYLVPFAWIAVLGGAARPEAAPDGPRLRRWAAPALLLLAAANLAGSILPERHAERAPYHDLWAFAEAHFRPGDVFILGRDDGDLQMALMVFPLAGGVRTLAFPTGASPAGVARFWDEVREALSAGGGSVPRLYCLARTAPAVQAAVSGRPDRTVVGRLRGSEVVRLHGPGETGGS